MTAALSEPKKPRVDGVATSPRLTVDGAILIRAAAGDASRAELQRDVLPIFQPSISGTAFRKAAELAIQRLTRDGLALDAKGRICVTSEGLVVAAASPALPATGATLKQGWPALRATLAVAALGITKPTAAQLKAAARADGLAALIVQAHYDLGLARVQSANAIRGALAVIALEQAFGDRIKTGLGNGKGLPGKAGRMLAGQLFTPPREFASDGKLVAALAAALIGARDATVDMLQIVLIRTLTTDGGAATNSATVEQKPSPRRAGKRHRPMPAAANDAGTDAEPRSGNAAVEATFAPPDLNEFSGAVLDAARPVSEGWSGNRKAFISLVWQAIRNSRPHWGLTEIAFKTMLSEAHRSGLVVLASADLKGRSDRKELEDSKILYKNTVWHFVRVED